MDNYYSPGLEYQFFPDDCKQDFVDVLSPVVKPNFTLFQMQKEHCLADSSEPNKTCLGATPINFYHADMATFIGIFIVSMVDPEIILYPIMEKPFNPRNPFKLITISSVTRHLLTDRARFYCNQARSRHKLISLT